MPSGALRGHLVQESHRSSLTKEREFGSALGTGGRKSPEGTEGRAGGSGSASPGAPWLCLDLISLWLAFPAWPSL